LNNAFSINLSEKQKRLTYLFVGLSFLLCGIFLLLVSSNLIDLQIKKVVIPTLILGFGLSCFASSFCQDNTLLLWLGCGVIVCAIGTFLGEFLACGYKKVIFVYFLAPTLASLFTMLKSKKYKFNLKISLLFALIAIIILLLNYFNKGIVLSCGLILLSLAILLLALIKENK